KCNLSRRSPMSGANSTARVEYRPIPGFPGYKAGDDGSIWSCWAKMPPSRMTNDWHQLKPQLNGRYWGVRPTRNGKVKFAAVHHLIALAFIGPRPKGMLVAHFP